MGYHLTIILRAKALIDRYTKILSFKKKCENPIPLQWSFLKTLLQKHQNTDFGRKYDFGSIRSIRDYQERVPIHPWEKVAPYIEEVKKGNTSALFPCSEKLIMFAETSGTTGEPKHIPITDISYQLYKKYWDHAWANICKLVPWTQDGKVLYFPGDPEEGFFGDIPYGAITAKAYAQQNPMLKILYPYPFQVSRIKDYKLRYYTIMRIAVEKRVTAIPIANPSTIITLFKTARERAEEIIEDIRTGNLRDAEKMPKEFTRIMLKRLKPNLQRAKELQKMLDEKGELLPQYYWPHPLAIVCFATGPLKLYLKQLEHFHDKLHIFDFGLLASEGRFSFPVSGLKGNKGCCLTIESNFFEFIPEREIDEPHPTVLTLDQCEKGKRYFLIVTNYSGLYRYHISDLIEITGFYGKVPLISFCNKGKNYSSITGEKLSEFQVTESVRKAGEIMGYHLNEFVVCLHWDENPSYTLIKESHENDDLEFLKKFVNTVDEELMQMNLEYRSKRQSMRLGALTLKTVNGGYREYESKKQVAAHNLAQYKHTFLVGDPQFEGQFQFKDVVVSTVDINRGHRKE